MKYDTIHIQGLYLLEGFTHPESAYTGDPEPDLRDWQGIALSLTGCIDAGVPEPGIGKPRLIDSTAWGEGWCE
jgi:hypothetical protein